MRVTPLVFLLLLPAAVTRATSQVQDRNNEALVAPILVGGTDVNDGRSMIVGGADVGDGRYEFFVQGNGCGGCLVAADVVLSSARCADSIGNNVLVGGYNSLSDGAESRAVNSDMFTHPEFNNLTFSNDLMLFRIEPSTMTPIELNNDTRKPSNNQDLTVIGFGHLIDEGNMSSTLQKAKLQYVSNEECNSILVPVAEADETMLCTMDNYMSQTFCYGDSGGPIFDEDSRTLMGIASFVKEGCPPDYPSVSARISHNLNWIHEMICNLTETPLEFCQDSETPPSTSTNDSKNNSNIGIIVGSICGGILVLSAITLLGIKKCSASSRRKTSLNVSQTSKSSSGKHDSKFSSEIFVQPQEDISTIGDPISFGFMSLMGRDEKTASVAIDYDYSKQLLPTPLEATSTSGASKSTMSYTAETSDISEGKRGLILIDDDSFGLQYDEGEESHYEERLRHERIEVQVPSGKLGMVINTPNNGIPVVLELINGSVLTNQVNIGDQLISVNGVDVRRMTAQEVSTFLSLKANQPRLLVFSRRVERINT